MSRTDASVMNAMMRIAPPRSFLTSSLGLAWLEANRGGLTILVHGLTGNDLEDHTTHAPGWESRPNSISRTSAADSCPGVSGP